MSHDGIKCFVQFETRRFEINSFYNSNGCKKGLNAKTIERQVDMLNVSQPVREEALMFIQHY